MSVNQLTTKIAKEKNSRKIPNFILKNIEKRMVPCYGKVLPKRFHLNGHTIGFHPQTQKLELHYMSPVSEVFRFKADDNGSIFRLVLRIKRNKLTPFKSAKDNHGLWLMRVLMAEYFGSERTF